MVDIRSAEADDLVIYTGRDGTLYIGRLQNHHGSHLHVVKVHTIGLEEVHTRLGAVLIEKGQVKQVIHTKTF